MIFLVTKQSDHRWSVGCGCTAAIRVGTCIRVIDGAYLGDEIDAELTLGKDVKYLSRRIPGALDDLRIFVAEIEDEAREYLEKQREWIN